MRRERSLRTRFMAAAERGAITWCWPVRYELTVDARGVEEIARVDRSFERLREIAVDRSVQRAVLATMRELAAGGSHGTHRYPLTDLTVAVAAQSAGLDVLHHDYHFDELCPQLGVGSYWISNPSA